MAASLALRHGRHLSTAATSAATPITISYSKNKLKKTHSPDEALKIYNSFTAANNFPDFASARYAQESTVRLLSKFHRFSEVVSLLESHKSLPQITQESFISSIIRSYGVAGLCDNALNTYKQMTELGTPRSSLSFNALLYACLYSKHFDRVPGYFYEFPAMYGFSPDKFSYGILIKSYCEMECTEMAMEKLNEMEEKGIQIGAIVFTPILHALYRKGMIDEAKKFWDHIVNEKGLSPDVGSYNVMLMNLQDGEVDAVKGLIEVMNKSQIKPDTISYNYLMTCYCKHGMMDEAKKVYDELKEKGCRPNSATFRTLVFYLCKHERFMTGYKVFKQSVKVHKIPDFNTLKHLVQGLVNKEHVREAKAMVRTVNKKFSPDMLKAWAKVADDLGLVLGESKEVEVDSNDLDKMPTSHDTEKLDSS